MHIVAAISGKCVQNATHFLQDFTKSCHCRCQDVAHHGHMPMKKPSLNTKTMKKPLEKPLLLKSRRRRCPESANREHKAHREATIEYKDHEDTPAENKVHGEADVEHKCDGEASVEHKDDEESIFAANHDGDTNQALGEPPLHPSLFNKLPGKEGLQRLVRTRLIAIPYQPHS